MKVVVAINEDKKNYLMMCRLKNDQSIISDRLENIDSKRALKIRNCSNVIRYRLVYEKDRALNKKVCQVYRCKDMFCPVCQKAKSQLLRSKLITYTDSLRKEGYDFLHLTLTLKNMDDPGDMLKKLWTSWRDLRRRKVMSWSDGQYVSLECTYSEEKGYHFHLHVLCATKLKLPLKKKIYIELENAIGSEWYDITGNSYIVKLSGVKNVNQFAKYVTKINDLDKLKNQQLVRFLNVMAGKKTYTKLGVFRGIEDNLDDIDHEEIKDTEEFLCYEVWEWNGYRFDVSYRDIDNKRISLEQVKKLIKEMERKKNVKIDWESCDIS